MSEASFEITPEPSEAERRAIEEALARARSTAQDRRPGAWWAAGLPGADDEQTGED